MKNSLAWIGIVLAGIGLAIAVFQDEIRDQQATTVESVTQQAMDQGRLIWSGERRFRNDEISFGYLAAGLAGFVLGLGALLKKENPILGLVAMAVAGITLSWHWLINTIG